MTFLLLWISGHHGVDLVKQWHPPFHKRLFKLEPNIRLAKVNTEQEQALASQYNIRSIPTLAIFKKGKEISRQSGAMGTADIISWIRSHL